MTAIRETIVAALPHGTDDDYSEYIDDVAAALTEREYAFSEQIIDAVSFEFRVSKEDVKARVEQLGMAVRPEPEPEPVPEPAAEETPAAEGGLESRVSALEGKVDRLLELAERHLGSRA